VGKELQDEKKNKGTREMKGERERCRKLCVFRNSVRVESLVKSGENHGKSGNRAGSAKASRATHPQGFLREYAHTRDCIVKISFHDGTNT